jgi:hypothetical protein
VDHLLDHWSLRPLLVWGLYPRLLGVVFLVSFASLIPQMRSIAGRNAALPLGLRLAKIRDAFPLWRRWVHFPTLLWLDHSDAMLVALPIAGLLCGFAVVIGGPLGFWGLLGCYVVYLSIDKAIMLIFPWDCVLFELAFLGLFLPEWRALPEVTASATPAPLLVWALRLVVFRVMFGFGKAKFAESTREDWAYLTGFLVNQPLPSKVGWFLQKFPVWTLKLALFVMFVSEIPAPLLIFHPSLGLVAAAVVVGLMVAIQFCGSFGYFSLVMAVASVALLDTETPRALLISESFAAGAPVVTNTVVLLQLLGALLAFPFNSWVGQHWHHWAYFQRAPCWLTFPLDFYRFFHALRWLHPYGVFPPKTQPGIRTVPIVEVSWDGEHWKEIEYPLACTRPESAPRFISPHHARGDQAVIYETFGLNSQSFINGMTSPGDPFIYTNLSGAHGLLQRLLEGHYYPGVFSSRRSFNPEQPPPKLARIRTFILKPTTLAEKRRSGAWWQRAYVGPHVPPVHRDPEFRDYWLPEPEQWHWEMIIWRRRSHLGRLMDAGARGEDPTRAILAGARGLTERDVARFWSEFIPTVRRYDRKDWSQLRAATTDVRARFDRAELHRFERVLCRLSVFGSGKLDPLFLRRGKRPLLRAKNYDRLWMLMHDAIWQGKAAFESLLADPIAHNPRLELLTLEEGFYLLAVCRFEAFVFEAQKLRLIHNFVLSYYTPRTRARARWEELGKAFSERVTAAAELFDFLKDKLKGPPFDEGYAECYPRYEFDAGTGVVRLIDESVTWERLEPT